MSYLESGKDFKELIDRELKYRGMNVRRETEELFFKLITVTIDYMDKFEVKEMMKKRPLTKNTW